MRRVADRLALDHSSSCSFSPGRDADELDRDVAVGLLAGELDHVRARSRIATGSPMSSTKICPRPPIDAGLDDQRDRLRDRHEVARHLGVRDRRPGRRARSGGGRSGSRCPTSRARCRSARRRSGSRRRCARRRPRRSTRRAPSTGPSRSSGSPPCRSRRARSARRRTRPRRRRSSASRACCCAPTRAGSPPSAARACTPRRGRRPPACSARRPGASSRGCRRRRAPGTLGGEAALVDELALDLEQRRLGLVDEDQPPAPMRAIWRQSSEPIEPPAPVTSTVSSGEVRRRSTRGRRRPARGRARPRPGRAGSARRGRRRPRSARRCPGSVLTGTPASRAMSTTRGAPRPTRTGSRSAPRPGGARARIRGRSSVVPSTRTPCTRRFFLRGSSSTRPIGV